MPYQLDWGRAGMGASCYALATLALIAAGSSAHYFSDTSSDPDSDQGSNNTYETRFEPWMFVSVPRHGIVPLQDAMDEGSDAFHAFMSVGEPLDSYRPIDMLGINQNAHNGAVVVFMLPLNCLGDYNGDHVVNTYDLAYFIEYYVNEDPAADLTRDGYVDLRDQTLFIALNTLPCYDAWGW
jgi:hypothetical protein